MVRFKVGDKVKRTGGRHKGMTVGDSDVVVGVYAGGSGVNLDKFGAGHSGSNLLKIENICDSWDYAEARRLQDAAKAAVEAYNEYIKRKPTDVFPEVWNPFQK